MLITMLYYNSKGLETTMYKNRIFVKLSWIYKRILYRQKYGNEDLLLSTWGNAHDMILGRKKKKNGQKTQCYPSYVKYGIVVWACVCVYK